MPKLPKSQHWAIRLDYTILPDAEPDRNGAVFMITRDRGSIRAKLAFAAMRKTLDSAVYQLEKSENTGYTHWQMYCRMTKPMDKYQVAKTLGLRKGEYWEPCENAAAYANYCRKEITRIEGPYDFQSQTCNILNALKNIE